MSDEQKQKIKEYQKKYHKAKKLNHKNKNENNLLHLNNHKNVSKILSRLFIKF